MRCNLLSKKLSFKSSKGFTLIELLVTTIIITILTSAVLVNYKNTSQQFALQRSANKLTQDLRRMQEMALSSSECKECSPVAVPRYGYGIRLETSAAPGGDSTKYIIYAHNDPDEENFFYNPAYDTIIENISLEKGIIIYKINGTNPHVCINVRPPDATTGMVCAICGNQFLEEIQVTLALENDTSATKEIYVNVVGLIYVE
jgi:prepilin-type N-terminal cleavage/methylation domain-containing protein